MRKITISILLTLLFLPGVIQAQPGVIDTSSQWTWLSGKNGTGRYQIDPESLGTLGVPEKMVAPPSLGKYPGTKGDPVYWKDTFGRLYFFGGFYNQQNTFSQVWRIEPEDSTWTWVHGPSGYASSGTKGKLVSAIGVPHPDNVPESRSGATFAVDETGCVWVFGGYDNLQIRTYRNDFWRYNPYENEWTYFGGSTARRPSVTTELAPKGVYGTKGVADADNHPGGRGYSWGAAWIDDKEGKFYMFSGTGVATDPTVTGNIADFWVYDMKTALWTWIGGGDSITGSLIADYGTKGVAAASNFPQPRSGAATWKDKEGNFWMYGGRARIEESNYDLNDMWKYDPKAGMWTWMSGTKISTTDYHLASNNNIYGTFGVYGTRGVASATNYPPGRSNPSAWVDAAGNFWLFGGRGLAASKDFLDKQNDMWKFNPSTQEWTWMNGSKEGAEDVRGTPGNYLDGWTQGGQPGGREVASAWEDKEGNVWIHSGTGGGATTGHAFRSDLWMLEAVSQVSATPGIDVVKLEPSDLVFCINSEGAVAYSASGVTFNSGNQFKVQLSDGNGSFANPSEIGALVSTSLSGSIDVKIPVGTPSGNGRRIRVVSTNPVVEGNDNGADIKIDGADVSMVGVTTTPPTPIEVCEGDAVTLTGSYPTLFRVFDFEWDNGVTNNASFRPNATRTYTMTASLFLSEACKTTRQVTITVNSSPRVTAAATPPAICEGEQVTLRGGGAVKYEWDNGIVDGRAFTPSGSNTYTVKGTDAKGCSNEAQVKVTVNPLPQVAGSATPTAVCEGEQVTLRGSGATKYEWNNGVTDGRAFTPQGNNTYIVKGTDDKGCTNEAEVKVPVNPLPKVTATTTPEEVCPGEQVTLKGNGAVTYEWDNNVRDGVPFEPSATTTYTVTGTDGNGCSETAEVTVTVKETFETKAEETICEGASYVFGTQQLNTPGVYEETFAAQNGCDSTVILTLDVYRIDVSVSKIEDRLTTSDDMDTYQWIDCDDGNKAIPGANQQTFIPTRSGNYAVIVSQGECVDTSTCYAFQATGVRDLNTLSKDVSVYPNPTKDRLNIYADNALQNADIKLSNVLGQTLIKRVDFSGNTLNIDLSGMADGIYILEINEKSKVYRTRIVKK